MPYTEIECKDADEFWDLLDPRNPLKKDIPTEIKENLIYRGQANADWTLMPSSLRNFEKQSNKKICKKTAEKHIEEEIQNIKEFVLHSSFRTNLHQILSTMDVDTLFSREQILKEFSNGLSNWPTKAYYPLVSLAQHHRVETCLLDWTKKSYIATYFASQPHLWEDFNFNHIAVWVYSPQRNPRIEIKELPLSSDRNMAAQYGLFSVVRQTMTFGRKIIIEIIDDLETEDFLWKIILNKRYVPTIMKYCHAHQIDFSSVYSSLGLDSVAEAVKERKRWEEMMGIIKPFSIFTDSSLSLEEIYE